MAHARSSRRNIALVGYDGAQSLDLVGPFEVFRMANYYSGTQTYQIMLVSPRGGDIVANSGLRLAGAIALKDVPRDLDTILVAGGDERGVRGAVDSEIVAWVRSRAKRTPRVGSVCSGAFVLAAAGLLDGRRATTHWAAASDLTKRFPKVDWQSDMLVTEDARLLCSGGLTAAADVSLYLVEKLCGHDIAVQTAKALLLSMPRASQSGYAMLPLSPPHNDDAIRGAEMTLQSRFIEDIGVEQLAECAAMSSRTFLRRFKAATGRLPGAYLQAVRIEMAKAMLERDRASVQSVANAVGYEDVSFFRNIFKRETGMTPAEYRSHFASMDVRTPDYVDAAK